LTVLAVAAAGQTELGARGPEGDALQAARDWLARELHDGVVQRLTVMVVEIEHLKRRGSRPADLERLQKSTRESIGDLRRLLSELRGEPMVDFGFVDSVRERLEQLAAETGTLADLIVHSWPEELPAHQAMNLRRIVGEAINNVRRHSGASRVTVTLQVVGGSLAITIADNGCGMTGSEGGFGLRGMVERARLLGGRISLDSTPGRGTTVRCISPLGGS
jgi:signal transduction histidine kinase